MAIKELHPALLRESKKTLDEALQKLNEYGKVFVCRPTGFGKTYMLTRVAKEYKIKHPDKKIAYIYPLDIIPAEIKVKYGKNDSDAMIRSIVNNDIDFISYMELTRKANEFGVDYWHERFENKYSIILLDEVHAAGSEGFRNIYNGIKDLINKDEIAMLGVTATPNRMDDTEDTSVLTSIFDDIQVYEYTLAHCIRDGILKKPVIGTMKYNMKEMAEQLKVQMQGKYKQKNLEFNENSFNVELSKIIKETGTEADTIYKYLPMAGYNLADPDTKYFKFIVFFNNIADVANKGPEVEDWFDKAFNEVAKRELNLKKEFTVRSHYLTSSDTEDLAIDKIVKESSSRFKYNNTKKLTEQNLKDKYIVDLILTVNMTNMGYHDDDITGIVMLRGTRSEVIYYQQLGRAISVTSEYAPLIYDFVNNVNTKFWSKKDREREIAKGIFGSVEPSRSGEEVDYSKLIATVEGDYDAADDFMNRWSDVYYSEKAQLIYLYEDRKAPIVAISADTHKGCIEIAKKLVESGITLRPEDSMFLYEQKAYNSKTKTKEERLMAGIIIKYIYSRGASEFYENLRQTKETVYNMIRKKIFNM
jgi:superfamily II DNA or RNA helicase